MSGGTYVVANPSSYAWPDANRRVADKAEYGPYRDSACAYDRWPYGWRERVGYAARVTDDNVQLTFTTIPACGHNARCMFTADRALPILFPK